MNSTQETALITGATSGIGYELAKIFAREGYNLVLVARNPQKLKEVSEEFGKEGAGKILTISQDLSLMGSPQEIYEETMENGFSVNAGVGEQGLFSESTIDKDMEILHLNIISLVYLTKLYLKEMLKRNYGKILQVSSMAAMAPMPLMTVYAASKAFVQSFTDGLINELKDTGVTITALIPGSTDTDFWRKADAEETKAAQSKMDEPSKVAKTGYEALMKGEHRAIVGFKNKVTAAASNLIPDNKLASITRKQMEEK